MTTRFKRALSKIDPSPSIVILLIDRIERSLGSGEGCQIGVYCSPADAYSRLAAAQLRIASAGMLVLDAARRLCRSYKYVRLYYNPPKYPRDKGIGSALVPERK